MVKNLMFNFIMKYIRYMYYFIRCLGEDEVLRLEKFLGSKNPTDMFIKGVDVMN